MPKTAKLKSSLSTYPSYVEGRALVSSGKRLIPLLTLKSLSTVLSNCACDISSNLPTALPRHTAGASLVGRFSCGMLPSVHIRKFRFGQATSGASGSSSGRSEYV